MDRYLTSHQRDYGLKKAPFQGLCRPHTAITLCEPFRAESNYSSQYALEFNNKLQQKKGDDRVSDIIECRNNPHPLKTFMNWKLVRKPVVEQVYSDWNKEMNSSDITRLLKTNLMSTYKSDYLPQNYHINCKNDQDKPRRLLNPVNESTRRLLNPENESTRRLLNPVNESTSKNSYKNWERIPSSIANHTTRYAANKDHPNPAKGITPSIQSFNKYNIRETSYQNDFHQLNMRGLSTSSSYCRF